jgi:hypothetical protein
MPNAFMVATVYPNREIVHPCRSPRAPKGPGFREIEVSMDALTAVAVLAAWFVLNRWLLPKLGVPT